MKPLNLPKENKEALLKGASIFLKPINEGTFFIERWNNDTILGNKMIDDFISDCSPYKIGDKVYLQEYTEMSREGYYESEEVKPSQCGYKATIKDIKIVRVQEIDFNTKMILCINSEMRSNPHHTFINWYNKQYKNYDENPYLFLYEVEKEQE